MGKLGKAFLVLLVAAAIAWAGDPWKEKPYRTWDRQDVMKVINDSPWAHVTRVQASWKPSEITPGMPGEGGGAAPPSGGQAPGGYSPGMGGAAAGGMGGAGGGGMAAPGGVMTTTPEAVFEARWLSSRVMREALARLQVLNGAAQEAQAESYVAQEPPGYQLWLLGPDMTPFANLDEKALAQGAYLEMKKSHERVQATSVEIQRSKDGKVTGLIYTFPKSLGNGQPVVPANEKHAEFTSQAGPKTTLRFTFDLTKMVDEKGRDL